MKTGKPRASKPETELGDKRLFHYTTASRLQLILSDGEIRMATAHVPDGERPTSWFSYNQFWEPTATKLGFDERIGKPYKQTFAEMAETDTPIRIEVDPSAAPFDWIAWRKASGVARTEARRLIKSARAQGADIDDYRMSFEPVGVERWLSVEAYIDGRWQALPAVLSSAEHEPAVRAET